jgi:hypothetical protein
MPDHKRQQIRTAAKTALIGATGISPSITYATDAGTRVYATRVIPFRRIESPALAVYTNSETVADNQTAPRELERTVNLVVEIMYRQDGQADNVDDALDALCLQIEKAMHADPTLGGIASDCVLRECEPEFFEEGDAVIGSMKLTYSTRYYTYAPEAADLEFDDLSTVAIDYDLAGAQHADDQASDLIEDLEE